MIEYIDLDEKWADSRLTVAGDYVFVSYCMDNEGEDIVSQINGAFNCLEKELKKVDLGLNSVVKMDCLFKDINDLDYLADVIKQRFGCKYPARKAYTSDFIRPGILFQIDAIAYKKA